MLFQRVRNGGGPGRKDSAPHRGWLVSEVPAGWAARVSLLQRSVSQGRWGGLSEVLQPQYLAGLVLVVDAHPVGGGVRGAGEGLKLLGDVLGRVGRVQVGLAVVVEVGDELVAL